FVQRVTPATLFPLSLHDALPIYSSSGSNIGLAMARDSSRVTWVPACRVDARSWECQKSVRAPVQVRRDGMRPSNNGMGPARSQGDRKSTRLNSSHVKMSYAVFSL